MYVCSVCVEEDDTVSFLRETGSRGTRKSSGASQKPYGSKLAIEELVGIVRCCILSAEEDNRE
jgi:hypothetical protein